MAKIDPPPNPDEIKNRREPKFIIDPKEISLTQQERLRYWALAIMQKNEHRLTKKWKNMQVVWSGVADPEDIDVPQFFLFPELNWVIYREGDFWNLMLRSREKILAKFIYARLDTI